MAENAKRKIIATTKVMFNAAKRLDLVDRNPFEFEVSSSRPNRDRDYFVTPDMTAKLIEAAPDKQWKLMIALWRLAGLRKMEIFGITWADVLWGQGRFRVRSPKTAHHEGRESRLVPIGPVLPYLETVFNEAQEGTERVVTRYSANNFNLHKPFLQIIKNAGLQPWPKLFQNLRSSCETEWLDSGMPAHVVANWIGHSVKVQNESYAQVDDHHFNQFNEAAVDFVAHYVAQKACETVKTPAKPCATECATGEQKTIWAIKKHGQKTVLHAPERSRTNAVSPAVQTLSESGGTPGGTMAAAKLDLFCDLLRDVYGFSNDEVTRILQVALRLGLISFPV
jgi:site-specific recombinase XerD